MTLVATKAAFAALGIDPQDAAEDVKRMRLERCASRRQSRTESASEGVRGRKEPKAPRTRDGSKQAQLIAMLRRAKGATIDEIAEALSWQPHTVRGAIAGALKKKLGLEVTSEKDEKRGRVYRVTI